MKQSDDQILLLRNMLFSGTIGGAFQRSGVYEDSVPDTLRREFRKQLKNELEAVEKDYIDNSVDTESHIANIKKLQDWSMNFSDILSGGKFNIGISQKLLNIHLKGLWCYGFLNYPPPHFPVDRIIQERLRLKPLVLWTRITDAEVYLDIIGKAEVIAKAHNLGLAELELKVYNGSLKIEK